MNIKELRQILGLSQVSMAHKLGVTPITVSRWERGLSKPNKTATKKIARLERKLV